MAKNSLDIIWGHLSFLWYLIVLMVHGMNFVLTWFGCCFCCSVVVGLGSFAPVGAHRLEVRVLARVPNGARRLEARILARDLLHKAVE